MEALRQAYGRLQVPRHPRKAVARGEVAEVQGAQVDGVRGTASPKAEKVAKYLHLCDLLLQEGRCTQKQMQIVAGGFVYFMPCGGSYRASLKDPRS